MPALLKKSGNKLQQRWNRVDTMAMLDKRPPKSAMIHKNV